MSNRRQRRTATSQARRNQAAPPPAAALAADAATQLSLAVQCHQRGDAAGARAAYENVLALAPQNIDALNLLGVLLHQLGELDAAAANLEQAVKLHPPAPELHFNLGNIRRDQQRHDQAAACFHKAAALQPDYFDAIYNLGVVQLQLGQEAEAVRHLERALALQDAFPLGHCLLADIRLGQADYAAAIAGYEKALSFDPDFAEARNNLAVALREIGRHDEAQHHLDRALSLKPGYVDAHLNLALLLQDHAQPEPAEHHFRQARDHAAQDPRPHLGLTVLLHNQGRLDEALTAYHQALAAAPDNAAILNNLGSLYRDLHRPADAIAAYERALRIDPGLAEAQANIAHALRDHGRLDEALGHYHAALTRDTGDESLFAGLGQTLARIAPTAFDQGLHDLVALCFHGRGSRHQDLAPLAAALVMHKYGADWVPDADPDSLAEFAADPVVLGLLESTINVDPALERLLTHCRQRLLQTVMAGAAPGPAASRIMTALACQGHHNGYIFAVTAAEQAAIATLQAELVATPVSPSTATPKRLAFAMYGSLARLPWLAASGTAADEPPAWWSRLFELTVREPAAERALRADIPTLGAAADTTSRAVQEQYETNPYPRWLSLRYERPIALARRLAVVNPAAAIDPTVPMSEVLIAGCGTGQQPIQFARANRDVELLAIDLSGDSLAYAKRMAQSHGVENIQFMQADILDLAGLERRFSVIECVGVLHHMADPAAGLTVVADRLAAGGFLKLGLYSRAARRHVIAAQELARQRRTAVIPDAIRNLRQQLLQDAGGPPTPTHPSRISDFYDLNGCRDLLLHVQEQNYSLPEVARLIADAGLTFFGFDFEDPSIRAGFRAQHPDDPTALADLDAWARYEARQPDTFIGMYQFWCRKPA